MLYIEQDDKIYGVEILDLDTELVHDLTFGSPVVHEGITLTRARVVLWYGPRDPESHELVKAQRFHVTVTGAANTLGAIEAEIRAHIVKEGL